MTSSRVQPQVKAQQSGNRFGWDTNALGAFATLSDMYLDDHRFRKELERLYKEGRDMDAFKDAGELVPSVVSRSWMDRLVSGDMPRPGDFGWVERQYVELWGSLESRLGSGHRWLGHLRAVTREWGLMPRWGAPWGPGLVAAMVEKYHSLYERARGPVERAPGPDVILSLVKMPHPGLPWPFAPVPGPDKTREQWDADIDVYREEGWAYIVEARRVLKEQQLVKAIYIELERDVRWLYQRITPPTRSPVAIAQREGYGEDTVKRAISKVAKLLNIQISPGARGKRGGYIKSYAEP